jgi:hypothetical protein
MPPNPVCPLTSGIIEDEIVVFKSEKVVFLLKREIYMSMEDFKECDLADGVIIRIGMADETPTDTQPTIPKPKKVVPVEPIDLPKPKPFNDSDYAKPEYNLTLDTSLFVATKVEQVQETPKPEFDIPVEGIIATVAMALAVLQQVKQKKNDVDEKTKQESKTLQAEMYEQYKELKDLKSDAEELKGVVGDLLTYIKNKSTKDV